MSEELIKTETFIEDGKEYKLLITNHSAEWSLYQKLHREKGPAYIAYGIFNYMLWYQNGLQHRFNGPSCIGGGRRYWFIKNIEISEEQHTKLRTILSLELDKV